MAKLLRNLIPGVLAFALVIALATAGYMALGWNFSDAVYMVVITVFGVGYGETQPIDTNVERWFTMSVILAGWASVVLVLGGVTRAVTEGELRRAFGHFRKTRTMEHLHNHAIICGYDRMGQALARELKASHFPFVVVDRDEERLAQAEVEGCLCLRGDATAEESLLAAGLARASVLATVLPSDALNVFITLTARNISRTIKIISRGEQASTEKKLRQAGADEVIMPALMGGHRIAYLITRPAVMHLLAGGPGALLDTGALGLEVDELTLHRHAHLVGKRVGDIHQMTDGQIFVLALNRQDGSTIRDKVEEAQLAAGDSLIVLRRHGQLPAVIERDVDQTELI